MTNTIKRTRGRPRIKHETLQVKKSRGRPKGSKNKDNIVPDTNSNEVVINSNTKTILKTKQVNTVDHSIVEGGSGTTSCGMPESGLDVPNYNKNFIKNDTSHLSEMSSTCDNDTSDIDINSFEELEITPEMIIEARRLIAKQSSAEYACLIDIPSAPVPEDCEIDDFSVMKLDQLADHHRLICNEVDNAIATREHNLMIFMPPGSAKSTYVDIVCATHALAKYPRIQVILASYSDLPAFNQSKKAKSLCASQSFQQLFPDLKIPKEATAQDNWGLSNGSSYRATGLFGDITSYRADVVIVDDPIKGREQAESETIRQKSWDSYLDNLVSRLKPGGIQIMILTRWHEDDIAGRILPEGWEGESGDYQGRDMRKWRVICLPAIADREDDPLNRKIGESIWPEWFGRATGDPLDHWRPFRTNSRTWNSLYQQKPSPDDGDYFMQSSFIRYTPSELPKDLKLYGTSDYAVSEGKGDFTVLRVWGIDDTVEPAQIYLVDGWKGKTKSDKWIKEQCKLMRKYPIIKWYGEAGQIQKSIEPYLIAEMRKQQIRCPIDWMPSINSKEIRARAAQGLVQEKRVSVPDTVEYDNVIKEYVKFPAGKNDDEVDCLSLIGRAVDRTTLKRISVKVKPVPSLRYRKNND
jgi:predicted phage terminase large subunit-like protein